MLNRPGINKPDLIITSIPTNKNVQITTIAAPNRSDFCSNCNMRFNTSEAYMTHIRNCHPSSSSQPSERNKMPFLTSILTGAPATNITPVISKPQAPVVPHPPVNITSQSVCNVASCNCSMKSSPLPSPFSNGGPMSRTLLANTLNTSNEYVYDEYHVVRETCYTCVQCQLTMHKLTDYMHHLKQEHCVEVYRCILCKQMQLFDNLNLLKDHFFTHHQSHKYDVFKCKFCIEQGNSSHKGFVFVEDLYLHLQQVHNQSIDLYRAKQKISSNNHEMTNSSSYMNGSAIQYPSAVVPPLSTNTPQFMPQKIYKCSHCDSDFSQLASLNQHIQSVITKNTIQFI